MVHETKESSLQKYPTDFLLAQLAEQETDDQEVVGSNPTGDNFLTKFILCCVTLGLSDNLTEMRRIGISWKTQLPLQVVQDLDLYFVICLNHRPNMLLLNVQVVDKYFFDGFLKKKNNVKNWRP